MFSIPSRLRGSMLVYGLVIMTVASILLVSILGFVTSHLKSGYWNQSGEQAFQAAESGVAFYRWYLAHSVEGKTAAQIDDFWSNGNPFGVAQPYEREYVDPSGSSVGMYRISVTPPSEGSTIVSVVSTGWTYKYPESTRTIRVRFRRPSWSEYILLGNEMQRVGSGTDVNGKVFVNNGIRFDGVGHNTIASAVESYYDNDSDVRADKPGVWTSWANEYNVDAGSEVFLAGKSYPEPNVDFASVTADLAYIKEQARAGGVSNGCGTYGCYFDNSRQGRHIVLRANGTFDIRTVRNFSNPGVGAIGHSTSEITQYYGDWSNHAIPDNGVIFVENNVWLEGAVDNERLTVVSANLVSANTYNVYIQRDITYGAYDGSSVLGVISQNDIEITKNSNNVLRIDGALLAQSGRVGRENYGNTKSAITVYGAIATNERYGFAYTDGTGYAHRNLYYDNNLFYNPPPYFPTGTQYLIDLWEEI